MNILEIEDIIKGLPDQSLMQEAQAPSGQVPQFLVVSEIQRRADMRKRYQSQQEQPQGTVAEQIVQGGIMGLGGQQQPIGGAPQQPQMPPQGQPPQGMQPPMGQPPMPPQGMQPPMQPPMSPPMQPPMMPPQGMAPQGMAAGGVVRMEQGRQLPYTGGTGSAGDYQRLIDDALMANASTSDIESLIANNPRAMDAYSSMSGSEVRQGSIPYGEEFLQESPEAKYLKRIRGNLSPLGEMPTEISPLGTYGMTSEEFDAARAKQDRPNFAREMNQPNYGLLASGLGFEDGLFGGVIDPIQQREEFNQRLEQLQQSSAQDQQPSTDLIRTNIMTNDFLSKYLDMPSSTEDDAFRFYEVTKNQPPEVIAENIESGVSTTTPEKQVQKDLQKPSELSLERPSLPDFSEAKGILDQLQGVDYSQFKPDYSTIISEQERRAQKIRDDASKDASAQALIQLGAGLAAGDIAGGLSKAGQTVADIKRQARGEAREEEALARKMRLAQDEAAMQIGLKQMEADRAIQLQRAGLSQEEAAAQAKAETGAYEFETTFGLSERKLNAEVMTELGRSERASLSAAVEQWKALADAVTEEDIATRDALRGQIDTMLKNLETSRSTMRSVFNMGSATNNQDQQDPLGLGV
jgi:hypothetical protein